MRWRPHAGSAQGDVHSLAATDTFLLTGGRGQVVAWRWDEVEGGPGEPAWAIQVWGGVGSAVSAIRIVSFLSHANVFCQT